VEELRKGFQEEVGGLVEGGGGMVVDLVWRAFCSVPCASFMSILRNSSVSRSAPVDSASVCVDCFGVVTGGGGAEVGGGAVVSLEPSGLEEDEACQNQPIATASTIELSLGRMLSSGYV
jgi:hypothetical protein